jgi:hypothetical protein
MHVGQPLVLEQLLALELLLERLLEQRNHCKRMGKHRKRFHRNKTST